MNITRSLKHHSLASVLAFLAANAIADAQTSVFQGGETPRAIPWNDSAQPGEVSQVVSGDLSGDGQIDLAVLDGNVPKVLVFPALLQSLVNVTCPGDIVTDIAVLEDRTNSGPDSLLFVGPQGLREATFDASGSGTCSGNGSTWFAHQDIDNGDPLWDGARTLRIGDLDGNAIDGVAGLTADRLKVLLIQDVANGGNTTTSIPLTTPAYDMILLNCTNASPGLEVAVADVNGISCFTSGGTLLTQLPVTSSNILLYRFSQAGHALDRMLTITTTIAGNQLLSVLDGTTSEAPLILGPANVIPAYAGTVGDYDHDGNEDFILHQRGVALSLALENLSDGSPPGTSPTFAYANCGELIILDNVLPASQQSVPLLSDLDGDGDPEFITYDATTEEFKIRFNPSVDAADSRPSFHVTDAGDLDIVAEQLGQLVLNIVLPTGGAPAAATDLELRVFRVESGGASTSSELVAHEFFDLASVVTTSQITSVLTTSDAFAADDHLVLLINFARLESSNVTKSWPVRNGTVDMTAPALGSDDEIAEIEIYHYLSDEDDDGPEEFPPRLDTGICDVAIPPLPEDDPPQMGSGP